MKEINREGGREKERKREREKLGSLKKTTDAF
jgi:hypothetical protein